MLEETGIRPDGITSAQAWKAFVGKHPDFKETQPAHTPSPVLIEPARIPVPLR